MKTKLATIDGATLMAQPLRPPNFIVDTLLSQGLHILAGSPKVGKSWLALWLAVTVAKGEAVWDMDSKRGTTLYLCLEDSQLRIQNRLDDPGTQTIGTCGPDSFSSLLGGQAEHLSDIVGLGTAGKPANAGRSPHPLLTEVSHERE